MNNHTHLFAQRTVRVSILLLGVLIIGLGIDCFSYPTSQPADRFGEFYVAIFVGPVLLCVASAAFGMSYALIPSLRQMLYLQLTMYFLSAVYSGGLIVMLFLIDDSKAIYAFFVLESLHTSFLFLLTLLAAVFGVVLARQTKDRTANKNPPLP